MPIDSQSSGQIAAALAQRIGPLTDAASVTEAIAAIWQEIEAALSPIIGRRGLAALYKRSLNLASGTHPWLALGNDGVPNAIDLAPLKASLAQRSSSDAAAAASTLFHTFEALLTSLVGASLTERLLRSVLDSSSSGSPAQDTTP
jgi:hypothetical protein